MDFCKWCWRSSVPVLGPYEGGGRLAPASSSDSSSCLSGTACAFAFGAALELGAALPGFQSFGILLGLFDRPFLLAAPSEPPSSHFTSATPGTSFTVRPLSASRFCVRQASLSVQSFWAFSRFASIRSACAFAQAAVFGQLDIARKWRSVPRRLGAKCCRQRLSMSRSTQNNKLRRQEAVNHILDAKDWEHSHKIRYPSNASRWRNRKHVQHEHPMEDGSGSLALASKEVLSCKKTARQSLA